MFAVLSLVLGLLAAASDGAAQPPVSSEMAAQRYGALPLAFERNVGQTDSRVQFLSRGRGYTLFLTGTDAVLATARATIRTTLVGAARHAAVTGLDQLPCVTHYYTGKDPSTWTTNVRSYARVRYAQVYPGIDVVYYGNQSQVEYDFLVAPGADPAKILLDVDGAERLAVDARGHLVAHVADGRIEWKTPVAYQDVAGVRKDVPVRYSLRRHHRVRLEVGTYDRRLPLVIDPVLVYSTYLGGSGYETPNGIAVDESGNAYLTGSTTSADFPGATGPSPNGSTAMFVASLNPTGSALRYTAVFASDSIGRGIVVDVLGNAFVVAYKSGFSFPTTPGAYVAPGPVTGAVVKLSPNGSIVYSALVGDGALTIAVDPNGNAYVGGATYCCGTLFLDFTGWIAKLNARVTRVPTTWSLRRGVLRRPSSRASRPIRTARRT
jgi:hypothetical protein